MKKRANFLAIVVCIAFFVFTSCSEESLFPHAEIFHSVVWNEDESLKYELTRNEYLEGYCVLETKIDVATKKTELSQTCTDSLGVGYIDKRKTVVQNQKLKPIESNRQINNPEKSERRQFSAIYYYSVESAVTFKIAEFKGSEREPTKTLEVKRVLPTPTDAVPDPVWYDDDSIFWLLRGIKLTNGYQASFTNVNAATGRVFSAHLEVLRKEIIEVPLGKFKTWKIKLETTSIKQHLWVEVDRPHRIIRAELEDLVYKLVLSD